MNVVIFCVYKDKADFFIRIADGLDAECDVTFITTRFHCYQIIKNSGYKVHMLQEFIDDNINIDDCSEYESDAIKLEVSAGLLREDHAKKQFNFIAKCTRNYFSNIKVDKLMLWNGSKLQGYAVSLIAKLDGIQTVYFEIGNFPNKLFIDNEGVNARSSLMYKNMLSCDGYDEVVLMDYLSRHKASKENTHVVPQAFLKKSLKHVVYDLLYNIVSKNPIVESDGSMLSKLKDRYLAKSKNVIYDDVDFSCVDYVFFPLQVSDDSQVIRNSHIGLKESLDYVVEQAESNKLSVLIKPHPAERNDDILSYIYNLKSKSSNIYLVNDNTYFLIKHAVKVITINSTVGIESLMYYKHTEVLGESFYKKYCTADLDIPINTDEVNRFLYCYLFDVLVEGDFFSKDVLKVGITC